MSNQEQEVITQTPEQLEQNMHKLLYETDILTPTPVPELEKTTTDEKLTQEIFS